MTLPADIARCTGYVADAEWREGCDDCARRLAGLESTPRTVWMEPPPIIVFECEFRIEET